MALIILEGLDRTGKSSVAQHYQNQGFEVVHMSAPDKAISQPGYVGPSYLDQIVELLSSTAGRDVILDRSHYGELVWPTVYGRAPLLNDEDMEILREIEESIGVERILMHDPNSEAHWQRCVDNNEPLTKVQFVKARSLFSNMADKYGFTRKTLKDFPDAVQPLPSTDKKIVVENSDRASAEPKTGPTSTASPAGNSNVQSLTKEQLKLERANAINEILSKRIIKSKGPMFDELERSIRHFLNGELGKIFGNNTVTGFTNEEVDILKFFCQKLKDKENS